jgi:tRNA 2-thiouridine synthesizing protein A
MSSVRVRHRPPGFFRRKAFRMTTDSTDAPDAVLDARGLLCPLPVTRTRQRMKSLRPEGRLDVVADDPLARLDLRVFCAREGHDYLGSREEPGGGWRMALRKSGTPARS